ncbi:MAG: zf-TFIIB domain-containing protein [Elusimicrobiota bacterium]
MTEAATLRCPSCGASVAPEVAECDHCRVALHPIRCPWCFGWTFTESRDCAHCGSFAEPASVKTTCPSCRESLAARKLGGASLAGCVRCMGVWADAASFKTICADRETQAAYLGEGSLLSGPPISDPQSSPIVYRPCAVCAELMNRFNFAGCSGVILDSCRSHGVWFDPDELRRIVEFIRGGGLDLARDKERRSLMEEGRRLAKIDACSELRPSNFLPLMPNSIAATRDLLRFLIDK